MKKTLKYIGFGLALLTIFYFLGPKPEFESLNFNKEVKLPGIQEIEVYLNDRENSQMNLKLDNGAKIVWADSLKNKSKYAMVYLHGFSASHMEGYPIHTQIAQKYGMNLFLSRLEGHGLLDSNSFEYLKPQEYLDSAIEALKIGEVLGDSVIIMSCSSGSTLAILLDGLSSKIAGQILYSPNIDMYNKTSNLITRPWGEHILQLFLGGKYNRINYKDEAKPFWNEIYHYKGIVTLKWIIKNYMTRDKFKNFKSPFFVSYYKKDSEQKDDVIDVEKIDEFYDHSGTFHQSKRKYVSTTAGAHVITSSIFSNDVENVRLETEKFIEQVLGIDQQTLK